MKTAEQRHDEYMKYKRRKAIKSNIMNHLRTRINDDESGVYDDESGIWYQGYISALANHNVINEQQFDELLALIITRQ